MIAEFFDQFQFVLRTFEISMPRFKNSEIVLTFSNFLAMLS